MYITERSSRSDLLYAAVEIGMADSVERCEAIGRMTDRELFESIQDYMERFNEFPIANTRRPGPGQ